MKNGQAHPKACQCNRCADVRFDAFVDRMKAFSSENKTAPTSPEQTVPVRTYTVRAHWRRNPNHLNGDLALRKRVEKFWARFGSRPA